MQGPLFGVIYFCGSVVAFMLLAVWLMDTHDQ